jgi:hypothetical protein
MELRKGPDTREGHYSLVFLTATRAVKVFKRRPGQDDHIRQVFASEVSAYEIARFHDNLKALVKHFVGPVAGCRIQDLSGNDISNEFLPACAYEMERLYGLHQD